MEASGAKSLWITFSGMIDQVSFGRLISAFTAAIQNRSPQVHIMLQSTGGTVADGVALYSWIRNAQVPITVYNGGMVQSIAVIAYLGSNRRVVSKNATFMIHKTRGPAISYTGPNTASLIKGLAIDDARSEAMLRERAVLSDDLWRTHSLTDLYLDANEALEHGIATEIGEFAPGKDDALISIP